MTLALRGTSLTLQPSGPVVVGVVEVVTAEKGQRSLTNEVANASRLHFDRADLTSLLSGIKVGTFWRDAAAGTTYRIQRIENQPENIEVIFHVVTVTE